ncbi:hypothetical protein [Rossellomorea aquimaris]|uniref:hypothetical protein n=1 Tax=Rossellomorea aquimaris TaxID=189382 RepID=UPI000B127B71|nr:hypothetical protein [Rossellomorea aquimaris]
MGEKEPNTHSTNASNESMIVKGLLFSALEEQCRQKRLSPSSGVLQGMPSCNCSNS